MIENVLTAIRVWFDGLWPVKTWRGFIPEFRVAIGCIIIFLLVLWKC